MQKFDECNLFHEIESHLLNDKMPSLYLDRLLSEGALQQYPYTFLSELKKVEQEKSHHPEGDVWIHVMMVVDRAAKVKEDSDSPRVFMWAALLHDLGKAKTTRLRNGKITAYDHDKVGEELCTEFLNQFTNDESFIYKVSKLVRWHMQPLFVVKNMPYKEIDKMKQETSAKEVALLSICDRLGRGELSHDKIKEEEKNIDIFIKKTCFN